MTDTAKNIHTFVGRRSTHCKRVSLQVGIENGDGGFKPLREGAVVGGFRRPCAGGLPQNGRLRQRVGVVRKEPGGFQV